MNSIQTGCAHRRNPLGRWLINRRLRKLRLDDGQRQQLDTVFDIAMSAHQGRQHIRNEIRQSLGGMIGDENFDRDRAVALIREASSRQADQAAEIVEAFGDLYETLDPQQRQQALAMWRKHRCWRSRRCHPAA